MSSFLYAEINIIGVILLLLMLNNMNDKHPSEIPLDQRLFNGIMVMNLLIFIFDAGMWIADGAVFPSARMVNYIATTGYYILNPMICLLWLLYTDFKVYESRTELKKRSRFYIIPIFISTIISLLSPFTGWYFKINEKNYYTRGPLFLVIVFITFSYIAFALVIAVNDIRRHGWGENKNVNIHLVVFSAGMMIVAAIQILFFGLSIIWVCAMLACTSIYINIQKGEIFRDYLTGLYNRRRLDQYLQRRIKIWQKNKILFAIILDMDGFKKINDVYGHLTGDLALVQVAELLRAACKGKDDFIARMGGDEFIIIGNRTTEEEILKLMEQIQKKAFLYNKENKIPYTLSFSMGYAVFIQGDTEDSFLTRADREMYRCKTDRKKEER